ncbi:hypothetical protein BV25DRAFT_1988640 [Artomyces pyxidatus]|uniref:Uncharacterized protein n=1 Tax=Artomyces pyxidatus TaxID=48021 RepID=A0ACB8TBN0_9AGAM|nr:hypothetical protein BV25DRAFT_1988640 [Artomyces pyxidatus]
MPYPLPLLPTTTADLEAMDPRTELPYTMAFMKNTLFRGLNNVHARATRLGPRDPSLPAFLTYTAGLCTIIIAHVKGDEQFFRTPTQSGRTLESLFGPACLPDLRGALDRVRQLRDVAAAYIQSPQVYDGGRVAAFLDFGVEMQQKMQRQVKAVDSRRIAQVVSPEEMGAMVQCNVHWFTSQCDIQFLLPYIHSHHDRATSQYWPPMNPEGWKMLPEFVQPHARCWELAPFKISYNRPRVGRK